SAKTTGSSGPNTSCSRASSARADCRLRVACATSNHGVTNETIPTRLMPNRPAPAPAKPAPPSSRMRRCDSRPRWSLRRGYGSCSPPTRAEQLHLLAHALLDRSERRADHVADVARVLQRDLAHAPEERLVELGRDVHLGDAALDRAAQLVGWAVRAAVED